MYMKYDCVVALKHLSKSIIVSQGGNLLQGCGTHLAERDDASISMHNSEKATTAYAADAHHVAVQCSFPRDALSILQRHRCPFHYQDGRNLRTDVQCKKSVCVSLKISQ